MQTFVPNQEENRPAIILVCMKEDKDRATSLISDNLRKLACGDQPVGLCHSVREALAQPQRPLSILVLFMPGALSDSLVVTGQVGLTFVGQMENISSAVRAAVTFVGLDNSILPPEQTGEIIPIRELEKRAIQHALRATGGSVERAARLLKIGRATVYRRLAEYAAHKQ